MKAISSVEYSEEARLEAANRFKTKIDIEARYANESDTKFDTPRLHAMVDGHMYISPRDQFRAEKLAAHAQSVDRFDRHMMAFHCATPSEKFYHLARADAEAETAYPGLVPAERIKAAHAFLETGDNTGYRGELRKALTKTQSLAANANQTVDPLETRFRDTIEALRKDHLHRAAFGPTKSARAASQGDSNWAGMLADAFSKDPARQASARAFYTVSDAHSNTNRAYSAWAKDNKARSMSDILSLPQEQRQQGMQLFIEAAEARKQYLSAIETHRKTFPPLARAEGREKIEQITSAASFNRTVCFEKRMETATILRDDGQAISLEQFRARQQGQSARQSSGMSR